MWTNLMTGSVPLALCTVLLRRIIESTAGRIHRVPETNSPSTTVFLVVSGALYYLYKHLRQGTLVSIGQRSVNRSITATPRRLKSRHSTDKSWFLKNLFGGRRNCSEAICKLAESMESNLRISSENEENPTRHTLQNCKNVFRNEKFYEDSEQEMKQLLKESKFQRSASIEKKIANINKVTTKKCSVKRLVNNRKNLGITLNKCFGKIHLETSRRTRSGKVYNPFN